MAIPRVTKHTVWQGVSFAVMARMHGHDGNLIMQANITSIAGNVFDMNTEDPPVNDLWNGAIVVATSVFDTLQTSDPRWKRDSVGYNFLVVVPGSAIPEASSYRGEVIFTPVTGDEYKLPFDADAIQILSS